mgnify:FL=1
MYQLNLDSPNTIENAAENANAGDNAPQTTTQSAPKFYVVGIKKFYALFFGTLGIYIVYWFYCHWRAIKTFNQSDIWPIPRSIFLVFFTHDLFREIDRTLVSKAKNFAWPMSPMTLATLMVVVTLISNGVDRFSSKTESITALDFVSLIFLPVLAWGFAQAQKAANTAADDPQAAGNSELSTYNYIWIALCGFLWLGMLYSLYLFLTTVI